MKLKKLFLPLFSVLVLTSYTVPTYTLREVYDAIKLVETGKGTGINVIGDKGKAYGPYQIHKAYFIDSKVKGRWGYCLTNKQFSEKVMLGYWKRYCPEALDPVNPEILARTHNGGPKGFIKDCTIGYWNKVKRNLKG